MGAAADLATNVVPADDSSLLIDYCSDVNRSYQDSCNELINIILDSASTYSIHLIGYSMGGRFLVSTLNQIYKNVDSITFISCGLPLLDPKKRFQKQAFDQLAIQQLEQLTSTQFCTWWYQLPLYYPLHKSPAFHSLIAKREKTLNASHIKWLINTYSSLKMPFNIHVPLDVQSLPKLTYIVGEHDQKYQLISNEFKEWLSPLIIRRISNSGHLCWNPDFH